MSWQQVSKNPGTRWTVELGSKLFTDLWTNTLLTSDLGQVSISRASKLHGLGFSSLGMVTREPQQVHLSPGLQWELFREVPKSGFVAPGQKCLLGLEFSTAVRSAYKEPCSLKMNALIFQCVDRLQALLRSLPGSQSRNCHPRGESFPWKWVSESTSNCQHIKP